jgi:hypothetical protein
LYNPGRNAGVFNSYNMADIEKCPGEGCKKKKDCWRHTAPNSHHQAWGQTPDNPEECDKYWDNTSRNK